MMGHDALTCKIGSGALVLDCVDTKKLAESAATLHAQQPASSGFRH
tara:strand:- start:370 stop:507 length:138 start_codon:yes stop_codon:yes gene_type:complete